MPPEREEVRRWLLKAGHDRSAARKLATPDCEETDVAAFHCQQAAEKLLKAYLVWREIEFERIHDLGRILDYCSRSDPEFEKLRDAVEPLTLYAVAFRYPGPAEPTRGDVEAALQVVDQLWAFVTARLPSEVVP